MAQEAEPPHSFQMLQILYKSFTKRSILDPRAPHGSGSRSARSFPNASNPLQILFKMKHSGASGASWPRSPIRQILTKCFKSFTNSLQNGAFWSLRRFMAQALHGRDDFFRMKYQFRRPHFCPQGRKWWQSFVKPGTEMFILEPLFCQQQQQLQEDVCCLHSR